MKAQDLQLTQLLQGAKQFIIPIFQRTYSWEISHCEQLWNDIIRIGNHDKLDSHFIGSAVYIPETNTSAAISRWVVIDGQQRITTITLLLLALMRRLREDRIENPVSADEIRDYFLLNPHGRDELKYKLLLTQSDKDTLIALLEDKNLPAIHSQRIVNNFEFFADKVSKTDIALIYSGIQKLMIVDVRLQQGLDNPQMIFESMNSTGKALTQADLIRNFVLMGLPHEEQTAMYNNYWYPMENLFGIDNYSSHFDEFMRFFLIIQTGNYRIKKDEVYLEFKTYSKDFQTEELLKSLHEFAVYYCSISLGKEKDKELSIAFKDIKELRADVCYPFLMELYKDYKLGIIKKAEFLEMIQMIESYIFRRAICDIPTHSLRQIFAGLSRKIRKDSDLYLESVKANLLLLPSYRRFPKDDEFERSLKVRNLYAFNRRSYWLRRFENYGRKERVMIQDYTIEHIMPQSENLSEEWRISLGANWKSIHEQYLHTLGNLTLTGYNSEYSNRSFSEKRDMEGGFRMSPLKLNEGLAGLEMWNENTIQSRANVLARRALGIWKAPILGEEILEKYKEAKSVGTKEYNIETHHHLKSPHIRELFDAFRTEVLGLDECVREEYLKLYIAYKAETNFVDVVPQARRLRISLNLDFSEIDDPKGICKDITDIGRWGNGNVEVGLEKMEDLPYIIGLVRQSLEKQLGDEDNF